MSPACFRILPNNQGKGRLRGVQGHLAQSLRRGPTERRSTVKQLHGGLTSGCRPGLQRRSDTRKPCPGAPALSGRQQLEQRTNADEDVERAARPLDERARGPAGVDVKTVQHDLGPCSARRGWRLQLVERAIAIGPTKLSQAVNRATGLDDQARGGIASVISMRKAVQHRFGPRPAAGRGGRLKPKDTAAGGTYRVLPSNAP